MTWPQSRVHRWLAVLWAILAIPTVTVWADAVWWVGVISCYANCVSHWGAAEAADAKETVLDTDAHRQ